MVKNVFKHVFTFFRILPFYKLNTSGIHTVTIAKLKTKKHR